MTPERFQKIGEIYDAALELAPENRRAYILEACAGDEDLLQEVESLLNAHDSSDGFIEQPALEYAARLLTDLNPAPIEGTMIANYRVLSLLGEGGMGEVYLARDLKLGRKVALKILPKEYLQDSMRVKLFEREARAASALNHPNIITIYEIGRLDNAQFIAAEYVDGQTMRQRIKVSAMTVREVLDVAVQTAIALAAAHDAGIVHRDIKPENVMRRLDGFVKVLDFGLAKLIETAPLTKVNQDAITTVKGGGNTTTGLVMGTVSYMSPEQVRGEAVDGRSDIFSLGVLIYEMATGQAPFPGATAIEVMAATLEREPIPLSQWDPQIPAEMERIVALALHKDREQRYQTVRDMLVDLQGLKQQLDYQAAGVAPALLPKKKSALLRALAALALALVAVGAIYFGRSFRSSVPPERVTPPDRVATTERTLAYHLIAQRDPRRFPGSQPFRSLGEHIFEAWYQARLMISSDQAGYLYVLNEGPPGQTGNLADYVLLFPDSDTLNWSAAISPNRTVQIPQPSQRPDDDWIQFDKEKGTEKIWLIWSEHSVPELEAVKHLANPNEDGAIRDPDQAVAIAQFLARHYERKPDAVKNEEQKQITYKAKGEVLVVPIRIEHQ
jgi:serine/threonine protein kinase